MRRPLFPRKQTWIGPARAGKLGEFQRFSPGGLFGLSFNFLRMNQSHRSEGKWREGCHRPPTPRHVRYHPIMMPRSASFLKIKLRPELGDLSSASVVAD